MVVQVMVASLPALENTPAENEPPASDPLGTTVMLSGSSSQVPFAPLAARVSTRMPLTSSERWPEVSTKPPLPPLAPPRASMTP